MRAVMLLLLLTGSAHGQVPDYEAWNELLADTVQWNENQTASAVDYSALQQRRDDLQSVLDRWSEFSEEAFEKWPANDQLAFLINLYNAWTLELVLREYPDLESIRDLGSLFRSPWKIRLVKLWGDEVSLDHVEHGLIRERFSEPRIHFAVNCASCGCPALSDRAYRGEQLDQQLEQATHRFLRDRSRNRIDEDRHEARLSPLFDWYEEDFELAQAGGSIQAFLQARADALTDNEAQARALADPELELDYTDYDWNLNDLGGCR